MTFKITSQSANAFPYRSGIPLDRLVAWKPGVTLNGGIPNRGTIFATLSPLGSATVTISIASPAVVSWTGHGFSAGQIVVLQTTGALPTGITAGMVCYIIPSGLGANSFQISASFGGAAINTSGTQSGTHTAYADDTAQIIAALVAAGAVATQINPQVVLLSSGVFIITGNGAFINVSYVTLRGSGLAAAMATGGTLAEMTGGPPTSTLNYVSGTWLVKADRSTNFNYGILSVGRAPNWTAILSSTNFTADAFKDSFSCNVASASSLSIGQLVLIDQVSNLDPNVYWGNRHDLSGPFIANLSGSTLTYTSAVNGPTGVDGTFNGTFDGSTGLTINSANATGYVPQLGPANNPFGVTIFDAAGTFYGYIVSGSYPNFVLSQSNSGATKTLQLGGVIPQINYPIFDSVFSKFYGFITGGTFPNFTLNQSNTGVTLTGVTLTAGGGSRRFFSRQDRASCQLMKIAGISGTTITFETPFYGNFKTAFAAQLSIFDAANYKVLDAVSVENLGLFGGMGGDFEGNLTFGLCTNSWVQGIESYWSIGTAIGFYGTYRCEIRGSFTHEPPSPNPGGGGYLLGLNWGASDNLVENNIMWCGNKEIVVRGTGGGNVIAYNYMDDAFGGGYPESPEAGVNAGHYGTPAYILIEGNYSQGFKGDAFWGNSIYITVFRNHLSGIRGCSPTGTAPNITPCNNLRAYTYTPFGSTTTYPYGDYLGRTVADIQANSLYHNFVGNVLGFNGQSLLTYSGGNFTTAQTTWQYEALDTNFAGDLNVTMWSVGAQQNPSGSFQWFSQTYKTLLRQGNWDWHSQSQKWHGIGGSDEYGGNPSAPFPAIEDSLYLTGKPSFFGSNPWPWVHPENGATNVLPAKARFDANTPNVVL